LGFIIGPAAAAAAAATALFGTINSSDRYKFAPGGITS